MLMRSSHQEDTIISLYTPNVRLSKFIRQTLLGLQREMGFKAVIVQVITMKQILSSNQKKINRETSQSNFTTAQMDLRDKTRPFHPVTSEYIFFPSLHGMFSRVEHMLGHRTSFNK